MLRRVLPELLDSLPPDDPAAMASRRDLGLINRLMGNYRWVVGQLPLASGKALRVLELGAGSGQILSYLKAESCPDLVWTGLDLAPEPAGWPDSWNWIQGDVFSVEWPECDVLVANLFLHHFEKEALHKLGLKIARMAGSCLFCEPRRARLHQFQAGLLGMTGIHAVTRHDARVSVQAGFRNGELVSLLGLEGWDWKLEETFLGAGRMKGRRL